MKKDKSILNLGNQPVSNRFKRKIDQKTLSVKLKLIQEIETGLIRLKKPTNPKYLMPKVNWITYNEPEEHLDLIVDNMSSISPSSNLYV